MPWPQQTDVICRALKGCAAQRLRSMELQNMYVGLSWDCHMMALVPEYIPSKYMEPLRGAFVVRSVWCV